MFIPFLPFLLAFSLLQTASAAPGRISIPRVDPKTILCSLQFAKPFLCPQGGLNQYSRVTPLGTATGVMDADGAIRYSLKYANAARWAPSTLVNTWSLPNGGNDVNALPLACPQPDIPASSYTEDCLSMVLYVPPNMAPLSNAPVMVWIHGGSFTIGSASEAGLDGSKLAIATNSIVAVVQYRLGALGFLAPNGQTNLALKDVVNALQFLKNNVAAFGGSPSKITVAGQSSGATMIRALLGVPSANSLFRSAILQSDAMNFGMLRPENQQNLMTEFKAWIGCDSAACQDSLALEDIVLQGSDMQKYGGFIDPAAGHGQPVRPVLDDYLTNPVEPGGTFPSSVNKPLMITTVLNEGTFPIYGAYQNVVPVQDFPPACAATFGPDRTTTIIDAPYYTPTPAFIVGGVQDARGQLDLLATDYLYKCSGWTFGRRWSGSGGQVFIGEYVVGSAYPANAAVSFCSKPGVVCHQDDIQIVFGTAPSPSPAQAALITEMQKRYASFLNNGNPNAPGLTTWQPATSSDARALKLGGAGSVPVGACTPSFWGSAVQYDYQFYYQ